MAGIGAERHGAVRKPGRFLTGRNYQEATTAMSEPKIRPYSSFQRRRESSAAIWIPACARTTEHENQQFAGLRIAFHPCIPRYPRFYFT
jgi:hypothetical protein